MGMRRRHAAPAHDRADLGVLAGMVSRRAPHRLHGPQCRQRAGVGDGCRRQRRAPAHPRGRVRAPELERRRPVDRLLRGVMVHRGAFGRCPRRVARPCRSLPAGCSRAVSRRTASTSATGRSPPDSLLGPAFRAAAGGRRTPRPLRDSLRIQVLRLDVDAGRQGHHRATISRAGPRTSSSTPSTEAQPRALTAFAAGPAVFSWGWMPDGSALVCERGVPRDDVVMLQRPL